MLYRPADDILTFWHTIQSDIEYYVTKDTSLVLVNEQT